MITDCNITQENTFQIINTYVFKVN